MKVLQREIDEIVRSCAEDENLRRIVLDVEKMEDGERERFSKKVKLYFSASKSDVERQSLRFFEVVLMDDVRKLIISRVMEKKGS